MGGGGPRLNRRPANANSKEKIAETAVIDRMLSKLNVVPVRDTRIIEIRYESPDPELAARIVNTLTSTYIKQNLEARSQASKETSTWLADQLAEQRRKVETSELALQKYRERGNSLSLDAGQNIVVQRLNALNSAVTQAKTDRIAIESLYRQLATTQTQSRGARYAAANQVKRPRARYSIATGKPSARADAVCE